MTVWKGLAEIRCKVQPYLVLLIKLVKTLHLPSAPIMLESSIAPHPSVFPFVTVLF